MALYLIERQILFLRAFLFYFVANDIHTGAHPFLFPLSLTHTAIRCLLGTRKLRGLRARQIPARDGQYLSSRNWRRRNRRRRRRRRRRRSSWPTQVRAGARSRRTAKEM